MGMSTDKEQDEVVGYKVQTLEDSAPVQYHRIEGPEPKMRQSRPAPMGFLGRMASGIANFLAGGIFGGKQHQRKGRHKRYSTHRQKEIAEKRLREKRLDWAWQPLAYPKDKWSASAYHCPDCGAKPSQPCTGMHDVCPGRPGAREGSKRSRMTG